MSLEAYPDTTLLDIDVLYRAKELERYAHARTLIDLKLVDMSARQLGKDDEREDDESEEQIAAWEARGQEVKNQLRAELYEELAPEHWQIMMILGRVEPTEPLKGLDPSIAQAIMKQLEAGVFTVGKWADSVFRDQLKEGNARARLEETARRGHN